MQKTTRRILALALTLVLVCALAVTALAARTATTEEAYYHFDMYADVTMNATNMVVEIDYNQSGNLNRISYTGSVSGSYLYKNASGVSETGSFTQSVNVTNNSYRYSKSVGTGTMKSGTCYIALRITTDLGTYDFAPNALAVSYPA